MIRIIFLKPLKLVNFEVIRREDIINSQIWDIAGIGTAEQMPLHNEIID